MKIAHRFLLATLTALAGLVATTGTSQATLIRDYELNGTLTDSLGGPSLTSDGGTIGPNVYSFGANQGLQLGYGALTSTSTYSIEMVFQLNTFGGYRKLIDFNSLASDDGFYFYPNNVIGFYPQGSGSTVIATPTFVNVLLTRDGATNTLDGYLNGVLQFAVNDTSGQGIFRGADSSIHFFEDDVETGSREATSGSVDCIRIYNTALSSSAAANLGVCGAAVTTGVPEPDVLPLAALGMAALVGSRRRKRA